MRLPDQRGFFRGFAWFAALCVFAAALLLVVALFAGDRDRRWVVFDLIGTLTLGPAMVYWILRQSRT